MNFQFNGETRKALFLSFGAIALIALLSFTPFQSRSEASNKSGKGLTRTSSQEPGIENYDIREQKSEEIAEAFAKFRNDAGKDAAMVADLRAGFVSGEDELRNRVPTLKIEYNHDLRIPETIGPDVNKGRAFLTTPSKTKRSEILRAFLKENNELIGTTDEQLNNLDVQVDYTNPDGVLSWAILEQRINGIPVSRGEVKAGFSKEGEIFRVINNLAPGLDYASISKEFGDPVDAVRHASRHINHEPRKVDTSINKARSTDLKITFGDEFYATTAEKLYFPIEPGVARPAWRVTIWLDVPAYEITVDAETGTLLRRDSLVKDQTQSVTYNVWSNSTSALLTMDSPAPLSPGPIDPALGTQGALQPRTMVTLIGNEAPNAFNNNGWITDGANTTSGNNTVAGLDRGSPNGVDAPTTGSGTRVFDFSANPGPGSPAPGDEPIPAGSILTPCPAAPFGTVNPIQNAAVTQMFYVVNRLHDVTYRAGFTEPARNFQVDNFGRGGTGGDPIQSEGQDCSGSNNANMASSSTDGTVGRMQMFVFTAPTPDRDGTQDADIIVHEIAHGITNRLHTLGITGTQGSQMHEGNGDFLAHLLLSESSDPINGVYSIGGYSTLNWQGTPPFSNTGNYYYGIRRFPKAVIAFTGGPLNRPHNPLTYADIDPAQINLTNGAFAPAFTGTATSAHDGGEIWSSMLWEVRSLLVARLGHSPGTFRMLQLQLDGMKAAPANPTMLQERNAIIAAAQALPLTPENAADVADVREGFRRRGMGFSAANPSGNTVVEAFDFPNVQHINPFSVSDSTGDNDGFPEPGENVLLSVPVTNATDSIINNVFANAGGGPNVSYGNIANGATVVRQIAYTVPGGATCGAMHQVAINVTSDVGAQSPVNREFRLGAPVGGAPVTFTSSTAVRIPAGTATVGVADVYPTTLNVSGLTGNKTIALELTNLSTTYPGDMDWLLVGPGGQKFIVMSDAVASFTTQTNAVVVIKDGAAATMPTGAANLNGAWKPTNHGAADPFAAPAPAAPYLDAAPAGAATFASAFGTAASGLNGTWSLYGVDDVSGDFATITGWKLTFEANDFQCAVTPRRAPFDFDGDGKTDVSIFRPSAGEWWIQRSTAGLYAAAFGASTDKIVPADYTGDGKADIAFFRPSTGQWFVLRSEDSSFFAFPFGVSTDISVPADYDGDGKADAAVFRPSTTNWFIFRSSDGGVTALTFGASGDAPVPADYDGDGKADIGIYRTNGANKEWWILKSTGGVFAAPFGAPGDKAVPGDYTGDGKADLAFFRSGQWFVLRSEDSSYYAFPFGLGTDLPAPGDYDGDGKFDATVFRPSTANWFTFRSTDSGVTTSTFGAATDLPVPGAYVR